MSMLKKENRVVKPGRVLLVQAQLRNLNLVCFMTMTRIWLNILFLLLNFLSVTRYSSIKSYQVILLIGVSSSLQVGGNQLLQM